MSRRRLVTAEFHLVSIALRVGLHAMSGELEWCMTEFARVCGSTYEK